MLIWLHVSPMRREISEYVSTPVIKRKQTAFVFRWVILFWVFLTFFFFLRLFFNFPQQTIGSVRAAGRFGRRSGRIYGKSLAFSQTFGTDFLLIDRLVSAATNSRIMGGWGGGGPWQRRTTGESRSDGGKFH